jgi:hypothetical protein
MSARILRDWGKRRFAVRVVQAPHHVVDADDVTQANADRVLLEAQHDVAVEEVARDHAVLEPVDRLAVTLAVRKIMILARRFISASRLALARSSMLVHASQDCQCQIVERFLDRNGQPRNRECRAVEQSVSRFMTC